MSFQNNELLINYHDAVIYGWELKLIERRTEWLNDSCLHFYFTHLQEKYRSLSETNASFVFMDPSVVSFWMHQCVDQDEIDDFCNSTLFPCRKGQPDGTIFIAVNDKMSSSPFSMYDGCRVSGGGSHWSLLVIQVTGGGQHKNNNKTSKQNLAFWHFDSVRNSGNLTAAEDIAAKLSRYVYPEAFIRTESPTLGGIVYQAQTPQQANGYDCGVHVLGATKVLSNHLSSSTDKDPKSNSPSDLEECLQKEMATDPQKFCSELRHEMSSEIRRLHKEAQSKK